jgi:hypothetical protein
MPPLVPATVSAGVVVAVATLTMPPVNDTLETVPVVVAVRVPVVNDSPVPTVTLLNPPAPFPYRIEEPDVAGA